MSMQHTYQTDLQLKALQAKHSALSGQHYSMGVEVDRLTKKELEFDHAFAAKIELQNEIDNAQTALHKQTYLNEKHLGTIQSLEADITVVKKELLKEKQEKLELNELISSEEKRGLGVQV